MRIRNQSSRLIALVTLGLLAISPAAAIAANDDLEEASADVYEHSSEEEQYALDAASSSPGATFFNESAGCAESRGAMTPATTTNSTPSRSIPSGHQVRGPWGDFFGRDYGDAAESMVPWTVPMSGGKVVLVHERAYPAFELVSQNLAVSLAEGKYYSARISASWVWRRIGGSYRMSTHSFGTSIDINWDTNPSRSDNTLITDMPNWYVDAWRDAGFCWGGDWLNIKDPMHFSWKGPAATPGYGNLAKPYAPNTNKAAFTDEAFSGWTGFSNADGGEFAIADYNGDGAPDLVRVRDYGADALQVSFARSSMNFRRCSISSFAAYGAGDADEVIVADYDGDSRPDLWAIDTGGSKVKIDAYTFASAFREKQSVTTGATPQSGAIYMAGDYNRDGEVDLYIVHPGSSTRVEVWSGSSDFGTRLVNGTSSFDSSGAWQFSIGDDDVDGKDDVVAIDDNGPVRLRTLLATDGFAATPVSSSTGATASLGDHFAMGDLDGDGRPDLWRIDTVGRTTVWRGGDSTLPTAYWYQTPGWSCGGLSPADPFDFNGDSFDDMALGAPGEDIDAIADAGAVNVIYGSKDGPQVDGDDLFYQDLSTIEGLSEAGDRFGDGLASGDFNGDGHAELVIAAPKDDVGTVVNGGLINVIMGADDGLVGEGGQLWHRDSPGVQGAAGRGDRFGAAVAAGDFDDDGFVDLAVGVPGDKVNGEDGAGSVSVLYGTKQGLSGSDDQIWSQDSAGIVGIAGAGDGFGAALAVGDFNRDGHDDLAIGAPGDIVGGAEGAGQIHILYGSDTGLTATGNDRLHQGTSGVPGKPQAGDKFGAALAVGDFDGDGYDDIAVGVPGESSKEKSSIGKVNVLFGGPAGVTSAGSELWSQASKGVGSRPQARDRFGAALASADFDDDGFDDLAVGVPGENLAGFANTGAVNLLYGKANGLSPRAGNAVGQGRNGLVGTPEAGDRFGASMRALDVNGNGRWDLVVGMPGEDLAASDAGAAILILGSNSGLNLDNSSVWHQDTAGIEGTVESGDGFGELQ